MSIKTLYQVSQPAFMNAAVTTLPLVLYSTKRTEPQFKYVLDVYYSGATTRLTRVKFANNNATNDGAGVIDLAPLIQPYLEYDQPWYQTGSNSPITYNAHSFTFVGGEEYADSTSGSVILYNGTTTPGEPAFTASVNNIYFACQEYNDGYNWDWQDYQGKWLTNQNYTSSEFPKIVYNGDYETISMFDTISGSGIFQNVSSSYAEVYSGSTLLHGDFLNGFTSAPSNSRLLRYIGIGPQNLSDYDVNFSSSLTGSWTDIKLTVSGSLDATVRDPNFEAIYYFKNGGCTNYDRTRFAFINKLGVWDYYNIDLPLKKDTKLTKKTTNRTHLQYQTIAGTEGGGVPALDGSIYNRDDRGKDIYYTETKDEFVIDTDWLDEGQANWLTEMFNSPDVYIQVGSYFQPINITSANYAWKANKRKDKIFKYNIRYQLANQRIARY